MHSWEGAYKGLAALSHELEVVRLGAGEREGAAAGRLLGGHFGVVTRLGGFLIVVRRCGVSDGKVAAGVGTYKFSISSFSPLSLALALIRLILVVARFS